MEKKVVTNESGKNQHTEVEDQNELQPKKQTTAERLAEQYNTSPATIKRNEKKAKGIDVIGKASPTAKQKILSGEVKIKNKDLESLSDKPTDYVADVAKQIDEGVRTPIIKNTDTNIIEVDFTEIIETPPDRENSIIETLKYKAESDYLLYRHMLDNAKTEDERLDIIAKRVGLSGRSEYLKIQRMEEMRDTIKSKGMICNYLDDYLGAVDNNNKIPTLLATYIKGKIDTGEKIDTVNIPADKNIIEEAKQELESLTTNYHKSISSFCYMDGLIENMDIDTLKNVRQRMEWTLGTIHNFFEKVNDVIGDGRVSPLSIQPIFDAMIDIHNDVGKQDEKAEPEPTADLIQEEAANEVTIELDSPETRERMLVGNKDEWTLSKIYVAENNRQQANAWRKIEIDLGLCDDNYKLLVSYEDYREFIIEYTPDKHGKLKTRIKKIKSAMESA